VRDGNGEGLLPILIAVISGHIHSIPHRFAMSSMSLKMLCSDPDIVDCLGGTIDIRPHTPSRVRSLM